jgi:hypothetical protein
MISRPVSFFPPLAVSALALGVVLGGTLCKGLAADRPRGRSIEFSDSKSSDIGTNLHQLGRSDSLKNLEQDLFKPFQSFNPKSSLDGVIAPPVQQPSTPAIQSKRVKELLDRRKNWAFMNPEDFNAGQSANEMFGIPEFTEDGKEKKKESAADRFYRKLQRNRDPQGEEKDEHDQAKRIKALEELDQDEEDSLPQSLRESEQSLKKMSEKDKSSHLLTPLISPNLLSDIFATKDISPERTAAQKPWMKDFQELNMPVPGAGTASLEPFSALDSSARLNNPGLLDSQPSRLPTLAPPSLAPPSPGFASTFSSPVLPGLPDFSARPASLPTLNFTPRIEPPRIEPPRRPSATLRPAHRARCATGAPRRQARWPAPVS